MESLHFTKDELKAYFAYLDDYYRLEQLTCSNVLTALRRREEEGEHPYGSQIIFESCTSIVESIIQIRNGLRAIGNIISLLSPEQIRDLKVLKQ